MIFLYGRWLALPLHVRVIIANEFGIKKVGSTHVQDNKVISDGYPIHDVEKALTVEAIQKFTGIENTDLETLWDFMIAKVEGRQQAIEVVVPYSFAPKVPSKKPTGRPKGSKNKKK